MPNFILIRFEMTEP